MTFDEPTIHTLAAEMFWRMAEECGVAEANQRVLDTEGRCLLEHQFDPDLWETFPLPSIPQDEATRVLDAVAAEALAYARDEENMLGQIYLDDRQVGRSPSAMGIDMLPLKKVPTCTYSHPIQRLGRLCVRHPLPAIVFADEPPNGEVIQVRDTSTALGFNLPMFLMVKHTQQVEDAYILAGYFMIPVPDPDTGDLWDRVIQNSTRHIRQINFVGARGHQMVHFRWAS